MGCGLLTFATLFCMTRICQRPACEAELSPGRRKFCSDKCAELEQQRRFRENNREKLRAKARKYRENPEFRERRRAYLTEWRKRNPDAYKEWSRGNAERLRAKDAAWRAANPDRVSEHQKTRRARRKGAPGSGVTAEDWRTIQEWADHCCCYCGSNSRLTQDHVVPLALGGAHDVSNIVPACPSCNSSKQDRPVSEWIPEWTPPWWIA